jgi:hypothetical protein
MNSRAVGVGILVVQLLASAVATGQPQAPWFGTWEQVLPPPASRFETPPYKKVTARIEPWEDGLKVTYDMVKTRGGITHVEWIGRFDGRDYPVQGVDYVLTNAYRVVAERSYAIDIKVDGRPAATATAVVSPDGRTLTVTTVDRSGNGTTTTAAYRKR